MIVLDASIVVELLANSRLATVSAEISPSTVTPL